ncbi:putative uncharacterized protein [Waddlia chondrophila 2032/99]|uniref:Uncharacterized protein n=2 Tax=Waddlia chondrophila TaxID=71667 RepID=D6YTP8_WADCW|nr:hypothetical protein [Waddlia chondrophila]ADI37509.1 hypothetical protein wcw_0134 [Waddlia chondrophila WSU 86-1044]CCB90475.1 putative uncharacterized protein [Waddlia chondrophila 2032/99]
MNCLSSLEAGMPVLGSLLPSEDAKCSSIDRLYVRTMIYQRALEALAAFETCRFQSLDVPAGDQACQIRAFQLCMLNLKGLDVLKKTIKSRLDALADLEKIFASLDKECKVQVAQIEREKLMPLVEENRLIGIERRKANLSKGDPLCEEFAQAFQAVKLKKQPILKEISELQQACRVKQKMMIEDDGLEMTADPSAVFIIRSYLVTLAKVDVIREEMGIFTYQIHSSPKSLQEEGFVVPTSQLIEIVEKAKKAICLDSIAFVQKEALLIAGNNGERLQKYTANLRVLESKERSELPFFYLTQVIFLRAMAEEIPVLLKVRNIGSHPLEQENFACSTLFKSDGSSYKVSPVLSDDLNRRVIVIEGFSKQAFEALQTLDYVEDTMEKSGGLLRLIDLNTAQHGQYTDTKSSKKMFRKIPGMVSDEEETLLSLFEEAVSKGFSLDNSEQLCIDHVFCDLLANQRTG